MKVLVTGATGFIGNYVINELLAQNVEVIATSTSREKAKKKEWYSQVKYVEYSITSENNNLNEVFLQADAVIHLAWRGLPNYKSLFHIEEEMMIQYFFIKKLIDSGIKNINITGTCFEYGMQEGCLDEAKNIANPDNPYSIAKDTLRKMLDQFNKHLPFSLKWMRLFYTHGKGQYEKSILPLLQTALNEKQSIFNMSGGEQIRDYLPVEEMAKYIVAVSLQTYTSGIINISSNKPIKIIDLVNTYLMQSNKTISLNLGHYPYADYEPFAFWGNNNKLIQIINKYESNRTV